MMHSVHRTASVCAGASQPSSFEHIERAELTSVPHAVVRGGPIPVQTMILVALICFTFTWTLENRDAQAHELRMSRIGPGKDDLGKLGG